MLQNYTYSVKNHKTQLPLAEWETVMMDLIAVQKSSSLHDKNQNERVLKKKLKVSQYKRQKLCVLKQNSI
jgi:hypothetical protein